jgi:hypothetical protein
MVHGFHIIQVPLIGLIALAVYLLTDGLQGQAVSVSRWAIAVFAVFFSAYDAAAGIGTGYVLSEAQGLTAEEQETIWQAVKELPELSLPFGLSIVGTGAWVVALISFASALKVILFTPVSSLATSALKRVSRIRTRDSCAQLGGLLALQLAT